MTQTVYTDAIVIDTLCQATRDYLEENCEEGSYALDDALEFIATHGEKNLVNHYDDYIIMGEKIGYDVVDAFVSINDISDVDHAQDAFVGCYSSGADFAEEYYEQTETHEVPSYIIVDWEATWESNLRYDFDFINGYVFNTNW